MTPRALEHALRSRFPDLRPETVQAYCKAIPPEYAAACSPVEVARHLRMTEGVDGAAVRVHITDLGREHYEVALAARDYFSEFSVITGLLAAFGLDIQDGVITTFVPSRPPAQTSPSPSAGRRRLPVSSAQEGPRILDVLRVHALPAHPFTPTRQEQFRAELDLLVGLLAQSQYQEARAHVNRRLTEFLSSSAAVPVRLQTIDIRFENRASLHWTVMAIQAPDTPGFLYAFSNALAMRGMIIHSALIRTVGHRAHDRFGVTDRHGRKIVGAHAQAGLRMTAVLIKQFTQCLAAAPDPAKALAHFDRMLDQILDRAPGTRLQAFLQERATLDLLARLFGTSDFLWEDFLRTHLESLLPVLQEFKKDATGTGRTDPARLLRKKMSVADTHEGRKLIMNHVKDEELFRIDMRHLLDPHARLEPFSLALTGLAEAVLSESLRACRLHLAGRFGSPRLANGAPCEFAICGLGKFGGKEMGYASDIEVLFAYEGDGRTDGPDPVGNGEYFEHLCREILQFVEAKEEGIFHLDARLRPHGREGLLASPLDEMERYYCTGGPAAPFERQALIKLRWAAGGRALGSRIERLRDRFVYSGASWDMQGALDLRRRQIRELVPPGAISVKHSPGGIIDIEYAVQYLQIMHGAEHPALRTPSTLAALAALCRLRLLSRSEETALTEAYLFLRKLIDALRIVRGNARDLVMPASDTEEFTFLARRMGYKAPRWKTAASQLRHDIDRHMTRARRFFTSRFEGKA